jgi:hypothetical protein
MAAHDTITPYAATKVVNDLLLKAGLKEIPPQMMYSYRRQNTGPKTWTEAAVTEWAKGYVQRRKDREAKATEVGAEK